METPHDILKRFQEENEHNSLINTGKISPDALLSAIQSGEVRDAVNAQAVGNNNGMLTDLLGGGVIGLGNMLNSTIYGGTAHLLRDLGSAWESISPFSGKPDIDPRGLIIAGMSPEDIEKAFPYQPSYITSLGNDVLAAGAYFDDRLDNLSNQWLGQNPSMTAKTGQGVGSSLAFLLAALYAQGLAGGGLVGALAGAATGGGLESLSESGGFLIDAYKQGKADDNALSIANKNFLANFLLNSGLDATIGRFNPAVQRMNPLPRWLLGGLLEVVNENIQEPSQQIIEQASQKSLENPDSNFWDNLINLENISNWWKAAKELAPEVTASTLLTHGLLGLGEYGLNRYHNYRNGQALASHKPYADSYSDKSGSNDKNNNFMPGSLADTLGNLTQNYDTKLHDDSDATRVLEAVPDFRNVNDFLNEVTQNSEPNSSKLNSEGFSLNEFLEREKERLASLNTAEQNDSQNTPPPDANTPPNEQNTPLNITTAKNINDIQSVGTINSASTKTGSNFDRVRTMNGTEVDVRYRIVDVDDLITSTKDTGAPNPDYPQELQPRQRNREASFEQIDRIASAPDPELLSKNRLASDGAPIIGSDLVVESGNGRIMGIRKAYKLGTADNYRQWLKDNAAFFGLDPNGIDNINKPVLVRERLTDVDRVQFTAEANESSIAQMSLTENALKDAAKINDDMLELYNTDKSLEGNAAFISAFSRSVLPDNERGAFIQADGRISKTGLERITNALIAKAYGSSEILSKLNEQYDDNVKNISDALVNAAPSIALFENGGFRPDLSIKKDIVDAIFTLAGIRSNKQTVEEYLRQLSMFDDISDEAKRLLLFFDKNKRSKTIISSLLRRYSELAMQQGRPNDGQGILPGMEDSIPHDSKMALLKKATEEIDKTFKPNENLIQNNVTAKNNDNNSFQQKNSNFNEAAERVRLDFKRQAINAGRSEQEAEYLSQIFIAGAKFFSNYAGMSIEDYYRSKNLSFIYDPDPTQLDNRGNSEFIPRITDGNGNIIQDEQNIIRMFQSANASTPIHEFGHFFLKEMRDLFAAGKLRGQALQDWITLTKWLDIDEIDFTSSLNDAQRASFRDAHEKLATAFEKYVMTGKAPNSALKKAFEAFKRWLSAIYNAVRNIRYLGSDGRMHSFSLSPDVTAVFDRILNSDNQQASSNDYETDSEYDTSYHDNESYAQDVKHGSGYNIENKQFDFDKIGTGRGIGTIWGAFFSDDEEIASGYKGEGLKNRGKGNVHVKYAGIEFQSPMNMKSAWNGPSLDDVKSEVLNDIKYALIQYPGIKTESVKRDLRQSYEENLKRIKDTKQRKRIHQKISFLFGIRDINLSDAQNGNIYDFDIPDDDVLLNLDVPLEAQSPEVYEATRKITDKLYEWNTRLRKNNLRRPQQLFWFGNIESGSEFYDAVVKSMREYMKNNSFSHLRFGNVSDPRMAASLLLDSFGIQGAYRGKKGRRDYAVWNEGAIKFLGVQGDAENYYRQIDAQIEAQNETQNNAQNTIPLDNVSKDYTETSDIQSSENDIPEQNDYKTPNPTPTHESTPATETASTPATTRPSEKRYDSFNDNVSVAQELLNRGRTPDVISMATGLVQDDNGKWIKTKLEGTFKNRNKLERGFRRELQRLTDKAAVRDENGFIIDIDRSKLSPNEQYKFDFIHRKMFDTSLMEAIDDEAIFNAYPQLRNVKYSEAMLPKGVKSMTGLDNGEYRITVNSRLNAKNAYAALYEGIQRVIQNIEGLTEIGSQSDEAPESESYNQFIGVPAAKRLDNEQGVTWRMDNYNIARNMEISGIHPHNIWVATLWGRGVDGKWRTEEVDGKLNIRERKRVKDLYEYIQDRENKLNSDPDSLDPEQKSYLNSAKLEHEHVKLHSLLNFPELFDAYPQLRNVTVIESELDPRVAGSSNGKDRILINTSLDNDEYHSTLLHETQHIIQSIEGFARGGNDKMFEELSRTLGGNGSSLYANPYLSKSIKRRAEALYRAASPKLRKKFQELRKKQLSMSQSDFDALVSQSLSPDEENDFRAFNDMANRAKNHSLGNVEISHITPMELYRHTAGEVEAENTVRRKNMSLDERRINPPDTTESVSRDEQFIIDSEGEPLRYRNSFNGNESYNQIVGIGGAKHLDEAENSTWRMDNLKIARKMERAKSDSKAIWAATGWIRGADGKWRMEIPDGKIIRRKINEIRKLSNEVETIHNKLKNNPNYVTSRDEQSRLDALGNIELQDFFDAPELFNAYPDSRNISVGFDDLPQGNSARYDPIRDIITINQNIHDNRHLRLALIHEIQHAVQVREGLSNGANYNFDNDTQIKKANDKLERTLSKLDTSSRDRVQHVLDAQFINGDPMRAFFLAAQLSPDEFNAFSIASKNMQTIHDRKNAIYSRYMRHAGETEARNTENRAYWSEARRKRTPLDMSEDVPRNEQIIGRPFPKKLTSASTESYNQVIGEKGARAIDEANGNTNLMDNLNVAKNMADAGKNAKTIRLATGWEFGVDNEWKFELPDGQIRSEFLKDNALSANTSDTYRLENVFEAKDIFKAYPELKGYHVHFIEDDKLPPDRKAIFFPQDKQFLFALGLHNNHARRAIVHEIQHAIQNIEGFALPISPEEAADFADSSGYIDSDKLNWERFDRQANSIWEALSPSQQDLWESLESQIDDEFNGDLRFEDDIKQDILSEFLDDDEQELFLQWLKYKQNALEGRDFGGERISPFVTYWRSSGEVEARNSEHRLNMSDENRRNSLLSETEDVHRDRQIVVKDDNNGRESYYQIGPRRKSEMDKALQQQRPDLNQKQRTEAINEIEKLGEAVREGGHPKVEKLATHWLLHGHVILPEDNYKIINAIRICEQHHLDPMRFDDPNIILAQYTIKETRADRRINPDNVKVFSHRVDYDAGISVYNVENSPEGQEAVRNIIDTHWGEDANPWCIVARDDDGTLDGAWNYWNSYNSIPKRIAFQNGKLLAFCASDDGNITWWNREDNPSSGIPLNVKKHGNTYGYSYNEDNGKSVKVRETLADGTRREWFENGQLQSEVLPDKTKHDFYKNGQLDYEYLPDGTQRSWYENGQLQIERLPDGTIHGFYDNGQLEREELPDGTRREWYGNGQLQEETLPDGTMRSFYKNGQLEFEQLLDGTKNLFYENGSKHAEKLPDGTQRWFYENGNLKIEELPDGIERRFSENGNLISETVYDREIYSQTSKKSDSVSRPDDDDFIPTENNNIYYQRGIYKKKQNNEANQQQLSFNLPDFINNQQVFIDTPNKNARKSKHKKQDFSDDDFWRYGPPEAKQIDINFPEDQIEDVRQRYQNTPQWLKAPNSRPTNLTERQWLQVRTPNFKKWFGEWEFDPENASKVVDENGEPLVVYHGSGRGNAVFFYVGQSGAIFSTSKQGVSFSYSGTDDEAHNYPIFLNIRNPHIIDAHGKGWASLDNDEGSTDDTVQAVLNGKYGQGHDGVIFRNIKDLGPYMRNQFVQNSLNGNSLSDVFAIFNDRQPKSATRNNGEFGTLTNDIYHQPIGNPREYLRNWIKGIAGSARNIFSSSAAKNENNHTYDNLRFENEDTENRYIEGRKGVKKQGVIQRIKNSTISMLKSLRGDFPELSGSDAAQKGLLFAKEQFRLLHRKRFATVHEAMSSFTRNLRGLSEQQKDLFARKRLLDDLMWRKQNYPDAELPFGFTDDMLRREHKRFSELIQQDSKVAEAIKAEEDTLAEISGEFVKLAGQLGLNLDDVLRNPHYYRHTILEYANAAAMGNGKRNPRYNDASLQQLVDSELGKITRRDYLKRFKGSPLDINTDYIQANGEVRAQMLTDIQVMKTLLEIKKKYDIAPKLRGKLQKLFAEHKPDSNTETHSQSDNDISISDVIPEGYSIWNPAGSRLISSANSPSENLISMALDDASHESGVPLDKIFSFLGDFGEHAINNLCVIPSEVAEALSKMGKNRERGMLGEAAKFLTNMWKKIVLFSPTRNLKYNFRNFTGDLDAVISGNPKALRFFGRAVKELTDYYRNRTANQDLRDYIQRSGGMRIESLNMDNEGFNKLQKISERTSFLQDFSLKDMPADAWSLIKDFFSREQDFTAWREHLLRYAAYLSYKQDMDSNDGTPLTWGASIPDEVMSVEDIRDRAYKMSNELLGAYDQISDTGKQLRDMLIPFWSWSEVNIRRYYRLLKNGLSGRNSSDFAKRFLFTKSARIPFYALSAAETFAKISLFTIAAQMFNRFIMGDDDDELPPDVKYKPHITLGKYNGQVYYFDRIGALGDAADWFALDSLFLDAKEFRNGQLSMNDYMKKIALAPVGKFLNSVNPLVRMPYELTLGRTLYPDPSHPRNINDSKKFIAQSLGLLWPYKAITNEPHNNWEEFKKLFVYSADADEAAYFYTLDKVREFQERVLGRSFNGYANTKRGQVLQKLKTALRLNDRLTVRECIKEYMKLGGNDNGLKTSMKSMNPLHGLNEDEQKRFIRWLDDEDKKYFKRADKYFHRLTDRFLR